MLAQATERTRAIVLTTQRTGSTFLVECLGSHPEIHCAGEILNGQPDSFLPPARGRLRHFVKLARIVRTGAWLPPFRLEQFYRRGSAPVRCCKVMYNQLARPLALRYFLAHREIRVIHLRRENLLKQHVSTLLMQKRRVLQATRPVAPVWIRVDPARAIAAMRAAAARYQRFEALFARHERLHLTHESLFDGSCLQAETARRICEFLGIAHHSMRSRIVKLNPASLRDMVTNYGELAEAISRSEFAGMLDETQPERPDRVGRAARR